MDREQVLQLRVVDLRAELQKLGLPATGRKDELQARLLAAMPPAKPLATRTLGEPVLDQTRPIVSPAASPSQSQPMVSKRSGAGSKLADRAARFDLPLGEEERRRLRQERFGALGDGMADGERLRARQSRFGMLADGPLAGEEFEAQKARRLQRFGPNPK